MRFVCVGCRPVQQQLHWSARKLQIKTAKQNCTLWLWGQTQSTPDHRFRMTNATQSESVGSASSLQELMVEIVTEIICICQPSNVFSVGVLLSEWGKLATANVDRTCHMNHNDFSFILWPLPMEAGEVEMPNKVDERDHFKFMQCLIFWTRKGKPPTK